MEQRGACLWNLYGPTETTVWATLQQVDSGDRAEVHMGRPIANTQAYVVDARVRDVPIGTAGALYLGGIGLARGYHNLPDLTADKFVPDSSGRIVGTRLYQTGNHARYSSEGNLEFLGRHDQQVKIRGVRLELGEVEAVLCRHPAVRAAALVALESHTNHAKNGIVQPETGSQRSAPKTKRLVAYVVSGKGAVPNVGDMEAAKTLACPLSRSRR